jgi:hypothetical protein
MQGMKIENWYKLPRKSTNCSIIWKALVCVSLLVGQWTTWRIGNKRKVWVGEDPWLEYENNYNLFDSLVQILHKKGIFTIENIKAQNP